MTYFLRKPESMDEKQRAAFDKVHSANFKSKMELFGAEDVSSVAVDVVKDILDTFNHLFFFGTILPIDIEWMVPTKENADEVAWTSFEELTRRHNMALHPTAPSMRPESAEFLGIACYEQRIGTLVHELIHAFLSQHACTQCRVYKAYEADGAGHGRGFQLIAKAIEENALMLLGLSIDIGRLGDLLRDKG